MAIRRRARLSCSSLTVPRNCQTTTAAAKNSITESRPNLISTIEEATIPIAASTVIQAMLAYSSQKPPAAQPGYHIVMHGQSHSRITSRYACRTRAHSASSP
jgi:hypothetical protein